MSLTMIFKEGDIVTASTYPVDYYFVKYAEDATKCSISFGSKIYNNQDTKHLLLIKSAHNKFKVGDLVKIKNADNSQFIVGEVTYSNFDEYLYRKSNTSQWIAESDLERGFGYNINFHKISSSTISKTYPFTTTDNKDTTNMPNVQAPATKTDTTKTTQLSLSDKNARIIRMRLVTMLKGITKNLQDKLPPTEIAAVTSLVESLFNSGIPDGVILAAVPYFVETFGKDTVPAKLKPVVDTLCKEFIAEGEAMIRDGGLSVVTDLVKPYLQELYALITTYAKPEEIDVV